MITQVGSASLYPATFRLAANSPINRQEFSAAAASIATVKISEAAQAHFSVEKSSESNSNSSAAFRVEGPVYTLEEIVKAKGGSLIAYKMTDAQINEVKLRGEQDQAREAANAVYAKAHEYQPVGQIMVNNALFATVFDSGSFQLARPVVGLSEASLSPSERLAEIARAVKGDIVTANLSPTFGGGGASAPEASLPPITARNLSEILEQDILPFMGAGARSWQV